MAQLVRSVRHDSGAAQIRSAARLMSMLEDQPSRLAELFQATVDESNGHGKNPDDSLGGGGGVHPACASQMVLGITGAPGAGKSTLTDSLVQTYRQTYPDRRIGVIAVDPSSPFTGGAVLGDRVRMMRHATDPMVFVRSLASRGHLGGLSLGVRGVLHVMNLLRCDLVIIETVGVGQSEVEIAGVADYTMIVFAPGQGDSIQMLKAGLMEIGDAFVVNKADRPGANELYSTLMSVLKLGMVDDRCGHHRPIGLPQEQASEQVQESADIGLMRSGGMPDVYLVSAQDPSHRGGGVAQLLEAIMAKAEQSGRQWQQRRQQAIQEEIRQAILEEARARVAGVLGRNGSFRPQAQRVLEGRVSVQEIASQLLLQAAGKADGGS